MPLDLFRSLFTASLLIASPLAAQAPTAPPSAPTTVRQTLPTIPAPGPVAPRSPRTTPQSAVAGSPAADAFAAIASAVQRRGGMDDSMRMQVAAASEALMSELADKTLEPLVRGKLLALQAQCAMWLRDDVAMDAAYGALLEINPSNQTVRLRWAQQCAAAGRWQMVVDLLYGKTWAPAIDVEAHITLCEGLMGIDKFNDAQGALNTALPLPTRTGMQQSRINALSARVQSLFAEFTKETAAVQRDIAADDLPVVEILTTKGTITLKLYEREAPNTVAHFVEHIDLGTYTGTKFHRPMRGFGVQGGDPNTKENSGASASAVGTGSGGWLTVDECTRDDRRGHFTGSIALAKRGAETDGAAPLTCGSQFYIVFGPAEYLNGGFTVFGSVVDGLDTARKLTAEDSILQVNVLRRNEHAYTATRLPDSSPTAYDHPQPWGMKTASNATASKVPNTGALQPMPAPISVK